MKHDIALIELAEPFDFTEWVQPACLPNSDTVLKPNELLRVSGFGRQSFKGPSDGHLHVLDVPFHSDSVCMHETGRPHLWDPETMFCAGYIKGGRDSCSGDSGGPIVQIVDNQATVVGIVSWGRECARPHWLGVY